MTSNTKTQPKTSSEDAVEKAVETTPGSTIGGVAQVAGISVSTTARVLSRLVENKVIIRHKGGRDGRKRLPDRFTLAGVATPAAASAAADKPAAAGKSRSSKTSGSGAKGGKTSAKDTSGGTPAGKPAATVRGEQRLKAGGLEPLVLKYLKDNAATAPHGPSTVAKALQRSSGAVGNCLVRLAETKEVKQDSNKPRRYSLAA